MVTSITARKIRVLLVCTDNFSKGIARMVFFDLEDCEVSTATDPNRALSLFSSYLTYNSPFDIVFLGVRKPFRVAS